MRNDFYMENIDNHFEGLIKSLTFIKFTKYYILWLHWLITAPFSAECRFGCTMQIELEKRK